MLAEVVIHGFRSPDTISYHLTVNYRLMTMQDWFSSYPNLHFLSGFALVARQGGQGGCVTGLLQPQQHFLFRGRGQNQLMQRKHYMIGSRIKKVSIHLSLWGTRLKKFRPRPRGKSDRENKILIHDTKSFLLKKSLFKTRTDCERPCFYQLKQHI